MNTDDQELRLDRTVMSVIDLHDASDKDYWRNRSIDERLEAIEINRQIVYGYGPTPPRFQRILDIIQR